MKLKQFLQYKNFVVNSLFVSQALKLNLSLIEFMIIIYFDNSGTKEFNIQNLTENLGIDESSLLVAFNKLIDKKLLSVLVSKNNVNKIVETINLDGFYALIDGDFKEEVMGQKTNDIYNIFEKEFGRPISSMEYEIINAWLDKNFSEELILGALKEAIYNGVTNLRYIDKILYEWQRKGFKTMNDVEKHMTNRIKNKEAESSNDLFDYNWLDENN